MTSSRRSKRRLLTIFATLVAVGTVVVVASALILNNRVERRLTAAIAAADRDDPRWRIDDVMADRVQIPDEENAALVVDRVLELLPADWPGRPAAPSGVPPGPPSPEMEALDAVGKLPENERMSDEVAATLRHALTEQADALAIARTLADFPRGGRPIVLGPTFLDTLLPETQATRNVARLLQMDAYLRAHDGDLDGALDTCRAMVNTGRSLGDEPFLISQLVRIAIVGVALHSAQRVLGQGEPSDAAMARLQTALAEESEVNYSLVGLRGERGGMDELIRKIGSGEIPIAALSGPVAYSGAVKVSPWGRAMFDSQRAIELEWMTDAVRIGRLPDHEQFPRWETWDERILATKAQWHSTWSALLPLLLSPATGAAFKAQARSHAEQRAMVLLLAAERHRRRHGAWPESAEAIDRSILPEVPIDPFDGEAMRYRRGDGQVFAYSVGYNFRDDRGAYNIRLAIGGGPFDVGTSGWNVPLRRRAATLPDLPLDVFRRDADEEDMEGHP